MKSTQLKVRVAMLAFSIAIALLSGQVGQASAVSYSPQWCYGYYNMAYYWYSYYGYPYYYYYSYPYYCRYGYYYSYGYDYYYYTRPSKYDLTVTTDPSDLGTVNGNGTYDQGSSASFSITRNIIQTAPNVRYVFSHWSGDYSGVGSSGTITMNGPRKIVAVYQLQYYLTVNVQPQTAPLPQGEGWYNAGETVTMSAPGQIIGDGDERRLVFQGWNVDGRSTETGITLTLKMDSPHTIAAHYKQQYYLQVLTDQGVAYGEGWYDAGTSAQIFVSTPVSTTYGVSMIFNGWHGDIQSNDQSTTVLMDSPKTAIASWRSDPTILNLTIALGIIAAFLVGAGILAYIALSRSRLSAQSIKSIPDKHSAARAESSVPLKKKTVPVKKKELGEEADTAKREK